MILMSTSVKVFIYSTEVGKQVDNRQWVRLEFQQQWPQLQWTKEGKKLEVQGASLHLPSQSLDARVLQL